MQNDYMKLVATAVKIIYQSNDTWYTVCDVETEDEKIVTIVGIMPYLSVGEGIEAEGYWVVSKEHGKQFKIDSYKKTLPKKKNTILRYLSSGAIKGIGPKIAQKIVDTYGEESFDVIANHPEWLAQINGISRKKAYEMSVDFKEKSDIRELMTFSNGAISPNTAIKISKKWGRNALGMIKENPYILCSESYGIGFKRADEIAFSLGVSSSNRKRIESGIRYVLNVFATRDGNIYTLKDNLIDAATKLLNVDKSVVCEVIDAPDGINGVVSIDIHNESCIALRDLYLEEMNIAKRLLYIDSKATSLNNSNIEFMVADIEARSDVKYAAMQKKAIWEALGHGVTVLTGGPGTGKTTVVKVLMEIFKSLGMDCALCAPTGRAAKRMSETTQCEAKTIHRLLEVNSGNEFSDKPRFMRDKTNPLDEDVIIIDEASMIDVPLMNALLMAVKTGARLILIGDINQLPSVGEGNVLNDIISSQCFSTVCLNEIFRQSANSGIVVNAHRINNGQYPDFSKKYNDFFFIQIEENEIAAYITDMCKNRLPKKYGLEFLEKVQIISPTKRGEAGTVNLNSILQAELNPPSSEKAQYNGAMRIFREGDRIMQMKNNYDVEWYGSGEFTESHGLGVFNGDVGKIISIDKAEQSVSLNFAGKRTEYNFVDMDEIELSYAITVHKSQGSEYPIVIIPISKACPPMLLTRNLIYTAITRAEKMVILVGDKATLCKMIDNNTHITRNTTLKIHLGKYKNEYS